MDTMTELGLIQPSAPEMERAVLGACLLEASAFPEVADILNPASFYVAANGLIWGAMAALYAQRDPIDILTVTTRLRANDRLSEAGGAFYVSQLTNNVSSSANIVYHARIIIQCYIARESIRIGDRLMKRGYEPTADVFDTLAEAGSEIRILNEHASSDERTMAEVMGEVVDTNDVDRGVRFGFDAIDQKLRAEPGTVTIIGARPAMGKTAFMLSSAWRQAQAGHRPYVLEMEMRDKNLANRLACGEVGIPLWKAKRRILDQQDIDNRSAWYVNNGEALSRMVINESASMKVSSLAARLDRAKRRNGIDVVWIDYIGLLQPSTKQKPGYDRMTAISNELRVLAKEIDLPFIVLAQLNRPVKGAAVKAPIITDLRDSGEIEQDAEVIGFLHRPKYYDQGSGDEVDFIIAKHRDGEDGIVQLMFDGPGVRMIDTHIEAPRYNPAAGIKHPDAFIEPIPF